MKSLIQSLRASAISLLVSLAAASSASAVSNGSFELDFGSWTRSGNLEIRSSPYTPSDGAKLVAFNAGQSPPNAVLSQTFPTVAGQPYVLRFDLGALGAASAQTMRIRINGNTELVNQTATVTGPGSASVTTWVPQTINFVANSPSTTLTFTDQSATSNSVDMTLDNVRLTGSNQRVLTVTSGAASAVNVGVSPVDLNNQGGGATNFSRQYPDGASVTLTAPASSGAFSFVKWQQNGADIGSGPIITVVMSADLTLNAVYAGSSPSVGTFVNGSFEQDFNAWTRSGNLEVRDSFYTPTDGSKLVAFNGGQTTPNAVLSQTFATTAGQAYVLRFDLGALGAASVQTMRIRINGTTELVNQTAAVTGPGSGTVTRWLPQAINFVANSATTTITFTDQSVTSNNVDMTLDNVRITNSIQRTLAVTSSTASAVNIGVSPADNNNLGGAATNFTRQYLDGSPVTLSAPPTAGAFSFVKWQQNGVDIGSGPTTTVIMNADYTLNAVYAQGTGTLVNGSFEAGYTGWTQTGNQEIRSATPYIATDGTRLVGFNTGQTTPNAVLSQSFATTPGVTYTLDFDVGVLAFNKSQQRLEVEVSGASTLLYEIVTVSTNTTNGSSQWFARTFSFVANSNTTNLRFRDLSTTSNGLDMLLDNVRVIGGVPVYNPPVAAADAFTTSQGSVLVVPPAGVLFNDTNRQVRILPLGDSITRGFNSLLGPIPGGYRKQLGGRLAEAGMIFDFVGTLSDNPAPGIDPNHDGVDGRRTAELLSNLSPLLISNPDAVLLHIGTNDILAGLPVSTTVANLNSLIEQITTNAPNRRLYVATLIPITQDYNDRTAAAMTADVNNCNTQIRAMVANAAAQGRKVTLVDMAANLVLTDPADPANNFYFGTDGIHPGPAGYNQMGDLWFQAMKAHIPVGQLTAVLNQAPSHGNLSLNSDGGFLYTPNSGFSGQDSFSYRANDGTENSNVATVSITVTPGTPELLANGSFENGVTGWSVSGNQIAYNSSGGYQASDGNTLMIMNAAQSQPDAVISQTFATVPGLSYVLLFDVGVLAANTNSQILEVSLSGNASLLLETINLTGDGTGSSVWTPRAFNFTADSTSTTLTFKDFSPASNSIDLLLDNVRVMLDTPRTLTVNSSPATGVAITVSPNDRNGAGGGNTSFTRSFPGAANVTLSAAGTAAGDTLVFEKWQRNGVDYGNTQAVTVTMDADVAMTAVYVPGQGPVANPDSFAVFQNSPLTITTQDGVLANDQAAPGKTLSAVLVAGPANGNLELAPNGSFTYTPSLNFVGEDSFTYRANDGTLNSAEATVTISVQPVPTPVFVNGSFEDDLEGWSGTGNRVVVPTMTPFYIPADGNKLLVFNGGDTLPGGFVFQTFTTIPGQGYVLTFNAGIFSPGTQQQKLEVSASGNATLLSQEITLTGISSSAPVWTAQTFSFVADSESTTLRFEDKSDTTFNIDLLLDKVQVGPRRLLNIASSPEAGLPVAISPTDLSGSTGGTTGFSAAYADGTVVNLSAPSTSGAASFLGWRKNGVDFSNNASTSVTVDADLTLTALYGVNSAPAAVADSYSTNPGISLTVPAPGVLGNDSDAESQMLTALLESGPANGSLQLNANGGFTYTPEPDFTGQDSFTYRASDGGLSSAITTVTIQVAQPELLVNGSFEDGETGWNASGNRVVISTTPPYAASHLSKLMVFNGGDTQPTAQLAQTFATVPGRIYQLSFDIGILASSTNNQILIVEVEGNSKRLTETITLTGNAQGNSVWSPRTFTFAADSASTTLTFRDNSGTTSNADLLLDKVSVVSTSGTAVTRALSITSSPSASTAITISPMALGGETNGTTPVSRNYLDGTVVTLTAAPSSGAFSFSKWRKNGEDFSTNSTTTVTMDEDASMTAVYAMSTIVEVLVNGSFEGDFTGWTSSGNLEIRNASPYFPTDGFKLVGFNTANTAPNAVLSQSFETVPGATYTLRFDHGALAFNTNLQRVLVQVTGNTTLLSQTVSAGGKSKGDNNWVTRSYTFVADSNQATLSFTDTSTNTDSIDMLLDKVSVTGNLSELGTSRTLTIASSPVSGVAVAISPNDKDGNGGGVTQLTRVYEIGESVTLNAPQSIENGGFVKWLKNGQDYSTSASISFAVDSGASFTAVYAVNVAPVAVADSYGITPDTTLTVPAPGVLANDSDSNADPLSALLVSGPSNGSLNLAANGGFSYTPQQGFTGTDAFTYRVNDGNLNSNTVTVSINVSQAALMVNGSFEDGETGWTISGNRSVTVANSPYTATDGTRLLVFNAANSQPNAVVTRTLSTVPGQAYLLSFDVGILAANARTQQLQVSLTGSSPLLTHTVVLTGNGLGNSVWSARSFAFVADSLTTNLTFTDTSVSTDSVDLLLDNVRVSMLPGSGTKRQLTVVSTPTGNLPVSISPADLTGSSGGNTLLTRAYLDGTVVSLTAPLTNGTNNFLKWQRNGVDLSNNRTISVTMDSRVTLTAVYLQVEPGTLVNGSFESFYAGWTRSGTISVETGANYPPTDGSIVIAFNSDQLENGGVLSQAVATTPGVTYSLKFDQGVLAFNKNTQRLSVVVSGNSTLLNQTLSITGRGNGTYWIPREFTFVADSDLTRLTFTDVSTNTLNIDMLLDHVRIANIPPQYSLTVNSFPSQGVPMGVSPADLNGDAGGTTQLTRFFPNGGTANLSAPTTSGPANFVKWQKNGVDFSTNPNISVPMDGNHTMTAIYLEPDLSVLTNGSFESGLTAWTHSGSIQVRNNSAPYVATDGLGLLSFNGGEQTPSGVLSQTFPTTAGTTYSVTFDAGTFAWNTSQQQLQVVVNGSGGSLLSQTVTVSGIGGGRSNWVSPSFTFVASSATSTITFTDVSTTTSSIDLLLDKVRVVPQTAPAAAMALPGEQSLAGTGIAPDSPVDTPVLSGQPGDFRIGMNASLPGTYVFERSSDLRLWEVFGQLEITEPGSVEIRDDSTPAERMFYRIGRLAEGDE
jgi:lysophospholipase L1-like esterase